MVKVQKHGLLTYVLILSLLAGAIGPLLLSSKVHAAEFTNHYVRLDRLTATTPTGGRVCARVPSAATTEASVQVTFPTTGGTDYIVNGTAANWTVNTNDLDSGQTAWPGIGTANNVTGKTVTFPSGDLPTSTATYCFNFSGTNTLTTSSAGATVTNFGQMKTRTSAPADIDSGYWGTTIIANDQVVVNAVVAPVFTMALNGSTDTFAAELSSTGVNTSNGNRTITINTNALNGWIMWAKGTNYKTVSDNFHASTTPNRHGALTSVSAGGYAISNDTTNSLVSAAHAFTGGTEDYGLQVGINADGTGGGTVSRDASYSDASGATYAGVIDTVAFKPIATANGTAVNDILNIRMLATIRANTPPGADYTDTITYVGGGQF